MMETIAERNALFNRTIQRFSTLNAADRREFIRELFVRAEGNTLLKQEIENVIQRLETDSTRQKCWEVVNTVSFEESGDSGGLGSTLRHNLSALERAKLSRDKVQSARVVQRPRISRRVLSGPVGIGYTRGGRHGFVRCVRGRLHPVLALGACLGGLARRRDLRVKSPA